MQKRTILVLFLTFCSVFSVFSQPDFLTSKLFKSPERKHQFWISWGYNRSQYTKSDIHFTGSGYDFTMNDVVAKDRQSPFDVNIYFNPRWWTVPQYNLRAGFFITDRFSLSVGHDHMKYVAKQNQILTVSGNIDSTASVQYAGTYSDKTMAMSNDFMRFEHTDGLNYISAEGDFYGHIWRSKSGKQNLDFYVGLGAGIVYPRSEVDMFNKEGANVFHFAGWGTSLNAGLRIDILPQLFLNFSVKTGFISMFRIITQGEGHTANHKFFFLQEMGTIGYSLNKSNRKMKEDNLK